MRVGQRVARAREREREGFYFLSVARERGDGCGSGSGLFMRNLRRKDLGGREVERSFQLSIFWGD